MGGDVPDAHPDCVLYVYDFEARLGEPHAYAKHVLRLALEQSGRRVGAFDPRIKGVDG